jgi:hypothetical protein
MKFVYRFTVTASGRRRAEVYKPETDTWRTVGINAAVSMIARGMGEEASPQVPCSAVE